MSFIAASSAVRERSVATIMGQVLFLVGAALGLCALGTYLGRDLSFGTARLLSFAGLGMLIAQSFVRPLRYGPLGIGWLAALAAALVVFYGLFTPFWFALRALAWLAEFRARRRG